jgi:ribose 5-phosphate isomerase B
MIIHLATDHAGFEHKQAVAQWLLHEGFTAIDHGAYEYDESDDFPDFIALAAAAVSKNPQSECAIIFGGSGQGEAMVANRFPYVRATVLYAQSDEIVTLSREHNNANVLSIGARFLSVDVTKRQVWEWLQLHTQLEERHQRRIQKLDDITNQLHS